MRQITTRRETVDLCKGYWNSQIKIGLAMQFFQIISLKSQQNADISIFLKKEGIDISSQISAEFAITYRKGNTFVKISKLIGKG